jgi:hypothetical protein
MALSATTLTDELISNIDNFNTEAEAIAAWATAFDNYWIAATANAVPVSPGSTSGAKTAMQGAMVGMSTTNMGATKIANGISDYWTALNTSPALVFATCVAIAPPAGLSTLQTALEGVFLSNTTAVSTKEAALGAIAGVIHLAQTLPTPGQATFPGAVVFSIL